MSGWISGPKSPGLNILEHELNDNTVNVFKDSYPKIISNGWSIKSVADAWGMQWYQNSESNTGDVTSMAVAGDAVDIASASAGASNSSSLASRSESVTSSEGQGSAGSMTMSMTSAAASAGASGASAASANAVASPSASKTGGAVGQAVPGFALGLVGVVAAVLL